jgi:hypothetical protein
MKSPAGLALVVTSLLAAASIAAAAEHVPNPNPTDDPDDAVYPAQKIVHAGRVDVDVWIDKDEGGVYRPGESMRVYFRSTGDANVLVFNVDTEGYVHLIYPYGPEDPPYVDGGRAYRIPSRSDPYDLVADGPPGIEYVVAVASPYPFQNLPWYLSADRTDGERPDLEDDDDDTESGQIQGDPYVGIDRIIRRIVPPGREDRVATNETYFYIGRRVEYPRYVCADCHYHPFYFDPYVDACSAFEIRVDATWAHYAPIRFGSVRPRYIYRVRPGAPSRYRQWKQQWSSLDGRAMLRTRFLPDRDIRNRRERAPQARPTRPEFRDLRRYREGRIWRGRDEILRLREGRDQVNPPDGQRNRDRGRPPQGTPPPDNRDRGGRGWWWQRGDRRTPEERRGPDQRRAPDEQRQRPEPPREERNRGDQGHRDDHKDQGNRDDHKDQGNRDDHKDQGSRDRGDRGDQGNRDRGDRGDRGGERRR